MFQSVAPIELTPQQGRVWQYLDKGSTLTNVVALTCLGVGSLTSRIAELRKLGFVITDELEKGFDGRSYKKYDKGQNVAQPEYTVKGE
ncbi:helix-turn-helix domain-containing protein [Rhizobium rhizogenes]